MPLTKSFCVLLLLHITIAVQCTHQIVRSRSFSRENSQKTSHSLPIRVRYGCLLWAQSLTEILLFSLLPSVQYHVILLYLSAIDWEVIIQIVWFLRLRKYLELCYDCCGLFVCCLPSSLISNPRMSRACVKLPGSQMTLWPWTTGGRFHGMHTLL